MGKYIYTYSGGIYTYTYSDGTLVEIPVLPKSLKQAITPQPKRKTMTKKENEKAAQEVKAVLKEKAKVVQEVKAAQEDLNTENHPISDEHLAFINDEVTENFIKTTETGERIDTETGEIQATPQPVGVASTYLTDMYVSSCMQDEKAYREGGKFRTKLLDMHADDELQIGSILGTVSSVERDTDKHDKAIIKMAGNFEIRRDDNSIVKGSQITLPTKAAGAIAGIIDGAPNGFEPSIFIEVFIKQYAQSPTGYTYIYKVQATAPEVSMFDDNPFLLTEK